MTMKTVPFTCTYLPGQLRLRLFWAPYFFLWLNFCFTLSNWCLWALGNGSTRRVCCGVPVGDLDRCLRVWHMCEAQEDSRRLSMTSRNPARHHDGNLARIMQADLEATVGVQSAKLGLAADLFDQAMHRGPMDPAADRPASWPAKASSATPTRAASGRSRSFPANIGQDVTAPLGHDARPAPAARQPARVGHRLQRRARQDPEDRRRPRAHLRRDTALRTNGSGRARVCRRRCACRGAVARSAKFWTMGKLRWAIRSSSKARAR